MYRCTLTLVGIILLGSGALSERAVLALEMYPPWIHSTQKTKSPTSPPWIGHTKVKESTPYHPPWVGHHCDSTKSPYFPPWIGTKCHQLEASRDGVWSYAVDWRDVDWSQAKGGGIHQRTQALSLWWESKKYDGNPPPRDMILEYFWSPPITGPGRTK